MKKKIIIIFNLLLSCILLVSAFNITSKAATKEYELVTPFFNLEFFEEDYHIFNKGYYLIVGSEDLYPIEFKGNVKYYRHTGSISVEDFQNNIPVESGYETAVNDLVNSYLTNPNVWDDSELAFFLRVDNYARLVYGEGGGSILYCFGAEIPQEINSNFHVVDFDSKTPLTSIEDKYTYSDNVDAKDELSFYTSTAYHKNSYPGYYTLYVEVYDTSGNVTTLKDYIYVHDFAAPSITSTSDHYELEVNTTQLTSEDILANLTIKDNVTGFETLKKQIDDTYKSQYNIVGDYSITYSATDFQGNSTTKVITIKIKDTTAPTISLKDGGQTIYTNRDLSNEEIFDLLDINDNYDDITYNQVSITNTSDGLEGVEYQVTVSVTDSNNNSSNATFTYYINDTTPPSITVRDTVYLEEGRSYTTEEIISILKNSGLISEDAVSVNIISEELISSSKEEDVYTLKYEQVNPDGTIKQNSVTLRYKKETNNINIYIIIGSSLLVISGLTVFIIKRKKNKHANK